MNSNFNKFKNMPLWAKIVVVIFFMLLLFSIGKVDLFLW